MPLRFPWKKAKNGTRISQLLKDQFRRRKNSASPLVVETGFPTSLVDLIVNHRDRFKRPSSHSLRSKRNNPHPPPQPIIDDPVFISPLQSPPPPPQCSPTLLISPPIGTVPIRGESGVCHTAKPNGVLVAALTIFFMSVLAMATKKFTLGITMSAFLLLFLEYLVKQLSRFLKPCLEAHERLGLMVMGAWSYARTMMVRLEEEDPVYKAPQRPTESAILPENLSFVKKDEENSIIQEIELAEPLCYVASSVEEDQYKSDTRFEKSQYDWKFKCEGGRLEDMIDKEGGDRCELPCSKIGKSHKAKIKSKMKILVPKKFRNLRKKSKDDGDKDTALEEKEKIVGFESRSQLSEIVNVKDECDAISSSGEFLDNSLEVMVTGKDNPIEREANSGYMVLLMVALLGLVGGRILALVCVLTWCILSRSREAIRRFLKVFIVSQVTSNLQLLF